MKIDASADILPNNGEALDEFASTFSRKNDDAMVIFTHTYIVEK